MQTHGVAKVCGALTISATAPVRGILCGLVVRYRLHLVDLQGDTGLWPYLTTNTAAGQVLWEAVGRECRTVKAALQWRHIA